MYAAGTWMYRSGDLQDFEGVMKLIKRLLTFLLLVALVACAVLFGLSNPVMVEVDFLAFRLTASVAIWIVGSLVMGGLLGLLAGTGVFFRLKTTEVRSSRKIKRYEQEIGKIQATAIKE
jgi:putative membrane protein